jgi:hypothetical protein
MTKLEDVNLCTCYNLRKTSRAITKFYDKMLEPSGQADITEYVSHYSAPGGMRAGFESQ